MSSKEANFQNSCPVKKESGLIKNSTVPALPKNNASKIGNELPSSTKKSSMVYSMNYSTPGSSPKGDKSLEKIESRESSLDSNISESDTVDRIVRRNNRLKMQL